MDKSNLRLWLNHPITLELQDLIREHRAACVDLLTSMPIEIASVGKANLVKGQIFTLEEILDLESFLQEKVTREVENDVEEDA